MGRRLPAFRRQECRDALDAIQFVRKRCRARQRASSEFIESLLWAADDLYTQGRCDRALRIMKDARKWVTCKDR